MGFFKTKLEKDYKRLSKEYEFQKLEEKIRKLEHENMLLKIDFEDYKFDLDHLKESTFIKSFIMKSGNGQWQRPIIEADEVAYGKGLVNATLPPSDGGIFERQNKQYNIFRDGKKNYELTENGLKELNQPDAINPSHYKSQCSLECIDAMIMAFGADHVYMYCCITAWKYMWRYENKNGIEDIGKARWYIEKAKELGIDQPEVWNLEYVLEKIEKVKGIPLC